MSPVPNEDLNTASSHRDVVQTMRERLARALDEHRQLEVEPTSDDLRASLEALGCIE